ncbi:multidrug resistance-associated protein 1-like [Aplysia californica]|uniref:Multidrug resistance-associated protein 1-like n=1 Tax=Aplysia californica TaxID=6500 RepID=A0ABM1VPB5_APLCA|nr:multidrug resistance-associated protein 1-like [Aplysia californica]
MSLKMFEGDEEQVCLSFQHPGKNSSFCESTTFVEVEENVFIFADLVPLVPWIPHFFLWAVAPLYLICFLSPGKTTSHIGKLGKMKMSNTLFMATVSAVQLTRVNNVKIMLNSLTGHYCCYWARLASLMLTTKLTSNERQRGTHYLFPLFVFWTLMLVSDSMSFFQDVSSELYLRDPFTFVLSACCVIGALIQFVISSLPDSRVPAPDAHPEELTSLLGKLTLNWITGIIWRGYRNGLKEEDVPRMAAHDRCQTLSPAFEKTWNKEVAVLQSRQGTEIEQTDAFREGKCQKEVQSPKVNLLKVLLNRFGFEYLTYQSIKLFFELTMFVEPLLMGCLLKHFQHRDTEPAWKGYAIVMGLFASSLISSTGHSRVWTSVDRLSKNIKSSLKMAVYKKALSARNEGKRDITTGEIVTLVADDCEKLVNASNIVFLILATPVQVSVALYMLYQQLGMGAFVGLAIMLSLIPLNAWVGKKLKKFEKEKSDTKDKRIKIMNEVLNGIKVLKLYAWEKSFLKKVMSSRDQEVSLHKKMCLIHAGIDFMFCTIPFMVRVGGFMTFVCLGGYLDPSTAFVTTSLFAILNKPFSIMAIIIPEFVQASDALTKLNKFLNLEDIPEDIVKKTSVCEESITIKDGVFTWDRSSSKNCIKNINVNIPTGQLVAIVGMVGSGKSSLLSAMLGEMEKVEGDVTVTDSTAYVPQEAWILNTSLKENVVFGSGYDTEKYNKVVDACALRDDFKLMSSGDKTLIGEKGINLSGGQKQRVSLARAVYADAGIYLLDDPLSAVDAHVGKHIFDQVIGPRGMLKGKTRVLVTHGVHWLPYVDSILVMKDGQIYESGTYKQLLEQNGVFSQFVQQVTLTGKNECESNRSTSDEGETVFNQDDKPSDKTEGILKTEEVESCSNKMENEVKDTEEETVEDDEEETQVGTLGMKVYMDYLKAFGFKYCIMCMVMFGLHMYFNESKDHLMAKWSDDDLLSNRLLAETQEYTDRTWNYLSSFTMYGVAEVLLSFGFISLVLCRGCEAAQHHHNKLLLNILRSPMSFFDLTPTGRIINRFSKDIGSVDGLGGCLRGYIASVGWLSVCFCMVLYSTPSIIPYMVPVTVVYLAMQRVFIANLRQLRRYRQKSRSPVFVHLNETLNGTDSVRAYGVGERFISKMEDKLENLMKFEMSEHWFHAWFRMRMTVLCSAVTLISGLLLLWDTSISPGRAGVVLMYATNFMHCLGWVMHHSCHTETELISLERVVDYSNKPTEASWETEEENKAELSLSTQWPESGDLVLDNYQTRYREGLDLVLKGVTCHIKSGEKVGIVGRTGAGKSSLTVSVFRLVEAAAGNITLDGKHIAPVGLHDLRSKLSILPQDPVIFGGSLRMNLDPFGEKTSEELWEALKHSHLKTFVEGLPDQLDHECGEGGKNLSMGQRQLVCLARTLLRQSPVLVLDEATAGVDMETDELIQKTIRSEFRSCTVLTIAHRLNTVMDYDRIMVLDQGKIKEFDAPQKLLADQTSAFYSMAKDANLV